jgi:hypothetical protein
MTGSPLTSSSVLSVEERLRHAVASLETLHRLASFTISQPHEIPLYTDLGAFANATVAFARTIRVHVDAVALALIGHCRCLAAPGLDATATEPTFSYIQSSDREIFGHLDKQARVLRVFATALDCYVNDVQNCGPETLFDMAAAVRAQGQSILLTAGSIEDLARRIQEDLSAEWLRRQSKTRTPSPPASDENGGAE